MLWNIIVTPPPTASRMTIMFHASLDGKASRCSTAVKSPEGEGGARVLMRTVEALAATWLLASAWETSTHARRQAGRQMKMQPKQQQKGVEREKKKN